MSDTPHLPMRIDGLPPATVITAEFSCACDASSLRAEPKKVSATSRVM